MTKTTKCLEAIKKFQTAKDENIAVMNTCIEVCREFLEPAHKFNISTKKYRHIIADHLQNRNTDIKYLSNLLYLFVSSYCAGTKAWNNFFKFIENQYIPEMENIIKDYEALFSESYSKLSASINIFQRAREDLIEIQVENQDRINELEHLYQNKSVKKDESIFNSKSFEYKPFREKMESIFELYNAENNELYQAYSIFLSDMEKIENNRAISFKILTNHLKKQLEAIENRINERGTELIHELNTFDMKTDIETCPVWNCPDEVTKIPEFLPGIDINFNVLKYLKVDETYVSQIYYKYAYAIKDLVFEEKLYARKGDRILIFAQQNKHYLVIDVSKPLQYPLTEEDIELRPEFERYLAKYRGPDTTLAKKILVVKAGDTCECIDELGLTRLIPAKYLERL